MFEDQTYSVVLDRMKAKALEEFPGLDTREGSVLHTCLAPAAAECARLYIQLDVVLNETFADQASRDYLIKRAAERGIEPKDATQSIVKAVFTPDTLEIAVGRRFSINGVTFAITEKISSGIYSLLCEQSGRSGNLTGNIVPVIYLPGLNTGTITEILTPGEDAEDTEVFRKRYFDSFESNSFGGNVSDYKDKIGGLDGVGGVKIYPAWSGGGTVSAVIQNSEYEVPSLELISDIQNKMDPVTGQGEGIGIAPIGHVVTVSGVTEQAIDIETLITYETGWDYTSCQPYIEQVIDDYLLETNTGWADTKTLTTNAGIIVRISQIETRLLNLEGILDIGSTKINGTAANYSMGVDQIAVRGTFVDGSS